MKNLLNLGEDCLSWDDDNWKVVWIAWAIFYKRGVVIRWEWYENGKTTCRIYLDMLYNDLDNGWNVTLYSTEEVMCVRW
jgi:hypothetical protein